MTVDTRNLTPRFVDGDAMRVIGLMETYTDETMDQVADQWSRFLQRVEGVRGQIDGSKFGIGYDAGQSPFRLDYLTGVMVSEDAPLPRGFVERRIAPTRHAVFTYEGHISCMRPLFDAIFKDWLPRSGCRLTGSPLFVEVYGRSFDPKTGSGTVDIWLPIRT